MLVEIIEPMITYKYVFQMFINFAIPRSVKSQLLITSAINFRTDYNFKKNNNNNKNSLINELRNKGKNRSSQLKRPIKRYRRRMTFETLL